MDKKPYITRSHDVHLDNEYNQWLTELIGRYRHAQIKAAVKVNSEKLLWNWLTGRDLVRRKAEEKWGAGIVEQLSLDLQAAFPGEIGFSSRNLWYMKKWYLFYSSELNQLLDDTTLRGKHFCTKLVQNLEACMITSKSQLYSHWFHGSIMWK